MPCKCNLRCVFFAAYLHLVLQVTCRTLRHVVRDQLSVVLYPCDYLGPSTKRQAFFFFFILSPRRVGLFGPAALGAVLNRFAPHRIHGVTLGRIGPTSQQAMVRTSPVIVMYILGGGLGAVHHGRRSSGNPVFQSGSTWRVEALSSITGKGGDQTLY